MRGKTGIWSIFDMNKRKKSCYTSECINCEKHQSTIPKKIVRNLERSSESTELFSHPTYLPLKDAVNIVKHQYTPGTKSSSYTYKRCPGKNNLLEDDKAASSCKSKHSIKRDLCEDEEFVFAYKPWPQIKKDMFENEDLMSECHCIKSQ